MGIFEALKRLFAKDLATVKINPIIWDESIEEWQKNLEDVSWQEAFYLQSNFVPRLYELWAEHDEKLEQMLWDRVFQIEQPFVSLDFEKYSGRILRVEDGVSNEEVKNEVNLHFCRYVSPFFVIEDCGKLRGFAVSPELVIVGITVIEAKTRVVAQKAKEWGFSLPTEQDAFCIETNRSKLVEMMKAVDVPDLDRADGFLLSPREGLDAYPIWKRTTKEIFYYDKNDDEISFLAKL